MKKNATIILTVLSLTSLLSIAKADQPQLDPVSGYQTLLDAIAKCPSETNPMTTLKDLNGNAFKDVKTGEDAGTVTAQIWNEPTNIHMKRPSRLLAHIYVAMRSGDDGGLVCGVTKSAP